MGGTRKLRATYAKPRQPWNKDRIVEENQIKRGYGLKNKKEIWKAKDYLNKVRSTARGLLAQDATERAFRENELLESLKRRNILKAEGTLDDVLALKIEDVLERRLQTQVWKTGMAATPKQARQFIVHGHILLGDRKETRPSKILLKGEESQLKFRGNPIFIAKPKEAPQKIEESSTKVEEKKPKVSEAPKEEKKVKEEKKEAPKEKPKEEPKEKKVEKEKPAEEPKKEVVEPIAKPEPTAEPEKVEAEVKADE